jgi:hypothetical protein
MRTPIQLVLSVLFLALTAAPARADLITYNTFGAVGALYPDFPDNPLGVSEGDPIHLVLPVDYDAPDLCGQPGKGLYQLPSFGAMMELNGTIYEHVGGFVEVNNAAGNCAFPGDDQTGVVIRVLVGNLFGGGMTLFGPSHVGETLPNPLFPFANAGGVFWGWGRPIRRGPFRRHSCPGGRAGACDAASAVRRTCGTRNSPAPSTLSGQSLAQRAGRRRKAGVDGVSERHIPRVTRLPHSHTHPFFVVEPSAGVGDRQRHRGQALGGRVDDHHGVLLPRLAGLLVRTPPQRSTTFSPR